MVQLDLENQNQAYRCGRLLAVLEQVQRQAIPGANTTRVNRFFGTASSAPASVFGRLLRGAQPHLAKLDRDRPGAYRALQQRLEEVQSGIAGFPRTLTLEEQGLFALGYYFVYGLFFSRLLLIYALLLSTVPVWGWHVLFEQLTRRLLRRSPPVYPTLIIGATREATALITLLQERRSPLTPVAILDGRGTPEPDIAGVPVRGKLNKLEDILTGQRITHLIQCSDLEQSLNLLSACRNHGITYMLLPSVLGIVERDERIETLEGRPLTVVRPQESKWKWFF